MPFEIDFQILARRQFLIIYLFRFLLHHQYYIAVIVIVAVSDITFILKRGGNFYYVTVHWSKVYTRIVA